MQRRCKKKAVHDQDLCGLHGKREAGLGTKLLRYKDPAAISSARVPLSDTANIDDVQLIVDPKSLRVPFVKVSEYGASSSGKRFAFPDSWAYRNL